jgi:hypothetical protein
MRYFIESQVNEKQKKLIQIFTILRRATFNIDVKFDLAS